MEARKGRSARGRKTRRANLAGGVVGAGDNLLVAASLDSLTEAEIRAMTPLDVMLYAMRVALRARALKTAAALARDAAPYMHARIPSYDLSDAGNEEPVIVVRGGLPSVAADSNAD